MSASVGGEDDRPDTLRQILSQRGSSLASELLTIQQHVQPVEKAHKWAANPVCLLYQKSLPTSFRLIHNRDLSRDFVAISWTWTASPRESQVQGKYSLLCPSFRKKTKLDIRDVIFDRIVKYLMFTNINVFWIDKICVDQENKARRTRAMNSMDLVYRNATKTLGLLSTPIRTRKGLHLMELLLSGQICRERKASHFEFQYNVDYYDIIRIIHILHDLTTDPWWTRAWIFQEEYLAGLRIDLLIPITPGIANASGAGRVPGELLVGASDLRKHATMFLLAYQNTHWKRYRASCDRMLGVIGKYNILLPERSDGLVCMSARIVADIGERAVTNPWDVLAITANACGYDVRLDAESLSKEKKSLSLCLLALLLLNGEVVRTSSDSDEDYIASLDVNVATLLKQVSLQDRTSWKDAGKLSFFKNCRLPSVQFCSRGVQTSGFLWELRSQDRIHTRLLPVSYDLEGPDTEEWKAWEAEGLALLALELRRRHPSLASKLVKYIDNRRSGIVSLASEYMDRMLSSLVRATDSCHVLRIGYLKGGGAGAIFVPNRDDIYESMHAFTAWKPGTSGVTDLDNFVSLKVDCEDDEALDVKDWMSGLAFFQGLDPEPCILNWPTPWRQKR